MAEYIVSARKYRPSKFSEMVGQEQVAVTLKNAIRTGHLAHSFLFCGPRGVGKTTAARILAKTINCEDVSADFEACGKCNSCVSFQQNASFNIHELDAASNNSVEDIRSLVEQVRFPPQSGKYKIYIIDEVHMLSAGAFNAFLKTLEEPPSYCKFILATTEKHKILPTILSRCQIFDFRRIGIETIVKHLRHICEVEKIDAEEDALHIIAQKADGGMRDALSMFDRLSSFSEGKLTYASVLENLNVLDYDYFFKVTDSLLTENLTNALQLFDQILKKGFEGDDFNLGLCEHFRNLLFCKDPTTLSLMELSGNLKQKYNEQSSLASADFLVNCLNLGNQCDLQYRMSKNKRLTVELTLIKMCYVNAVVSVDADTSKKKLSESVKEEIKAAKTDQKAPLTEVKQPKAEEPKQEAAKPGTAEKPVTRSATPVSITKSKKVLTLDALNDAEDNSPEQKLLDEVNEDRYDGEVLLLNAENILKLWDEYAAGIPETKRGLRISFANFKPELDETVLNRITLKVQSDIQKNLFDEVRLGLQNYISRRVGAEITLDIIADKKVETGTKPYTPKEKFERLIEKNPAIKTMQQKFGLELDYD
ncbi:MAG TPA: DNA polymerase III subunit gamma/tau [Chitinophagales bacterium]|nr:DNA polymerase III subunit gamma/tau [Chitinophagales bacterium]